MSQHAQNLHLLEALINLAVAYYDQGGGTKSILTPLHATRAEVLTRMDAGRTVATVTGSGESLL